MGIRERQRLWPSCLAALIMLAALAFFLQPMLSAAAAPGAASAAANPVRVRISPATGALGGGPLPPGEAAYRPVGVHNDGRSAFRYHLSIRAVGPLASLVVVEVRAVRGPCGAGTFAASGVHVAGPAPVDQLVREGRRVLAPGAVDLLCARVELPADAVVAAGTATDAVLRVTAVQH